MKIELTIKNTENVGGITESKRVEIEEIVTALITSGGLTGVKGGQTIIHFDGDGVFQKIELKYFPWMRRAIHR